MEGINEKSKQELKQLLSAFDKAINIHTICSITNLEGKIVYANKQFSAISGFTNFELIGSDFKTHNSGLHPKSFFREMWNTIKSGETWHGEIMNKAKDGTYHWFDMVIVPVCDNDEKIVQYLSLQTPISDRIKAKLVEEKYLFMLKGLLEKASQEIKVPLIGWGRLLPRYEMSAAEKVNAWDLQKIFDHTNRSALELEKLVKKIDDLIDTLDVKWEA